MKAVKAFLPHLCLSMALGLAVLVFLEGRNPVMAFLSSPASRVYILCFCVLVLFLCAFCIIDNRKIASTVNTAQNPKE